MKNDDEENSYCSIGMHLHDYQLKEYFPTGMIERCTFCGDEQYFRYDVPNSNYLSFHLRSRLKKTDYRFNYEYGQTN